jgi:tetratricopeptide (TPR) repeat protein
MTPGRDRLPEQTSDAKSVETEALLAQAAACTKRGDTAQAQKLIQRVLVRDPRHPGALVELGRVAYLTGNKRAAADSLRKAIASQPDNAQYHNQLGFVLIELGERQQALGAFMRALEIKPDDPDTITNLGILHLGDSQLIQAVASYRRALEIDPLHLNAQVERLIDAEPGLIYPRLIEATGRCPPEDVGGPWGYPEFLDAIHDPKHERHAEFSEWIGDDFDPNFVDIDGLANEVTALAKTWSRKPAAKRKRRS